MPNVDVSTIYSTTRKCRKYVLINDTVTGETYRAFVSLLSYFLAPTGDMLRVSLLVPLVARLAEHMPAWPFVGRTPPLLTRSMTVGRHGEVNLSLHLAYPVDMHVGIPRGLRVGQPSTRLQLEYAQSGDLSQAPRHPRVPRAFPWPAPIAIDGPRRRPAPKLVRTPVLNDFHTRSGQVYERQGPAKRKRGAQ